ncbi:hypothetical protein CRE_16642 [Caenorhabditis remanei]|uniref:Uncharacterized protein n=1 Tax=Caenorhabditis remanei TaxID=31234 RepID=E3MAW2_CAERE|nr:hypothetical protein CRE_16642 [Caenorhabditis remanei]
MNTQNYGKNKGYRPYNGRSYHDQHHHGNQSHAQPPQQNYQQQQPPPSSQPYYFNPPPQHDEQSREKPSSGTGQYQQGASSGNGQYQQGASSGNGLYQQGPSSGNGQYQQGPSSGANQPSQGPLLGTDQYPQGPPSPPPGFQVYRVPFGYAPGYAPPNQGMPYHVAPIQMSIIPHPAQMMKMNYLHSTIPPPNFNMPIMSYAIYNGNANMNNNVQNPPPHPPPSQQSEMQNYQEQNQYQENSQQNNTGQQNGDHFSSIGKFDYRELPEYNQRRRPYQNVTMLPPQLMQQMQFPHSQFFQHSQQYSQNQSFQENNSVQQGQQMIVPPPQTTVPAPQYRNSPSVETNATRTDSAFDEGSSPRAPRAEVQTARGTFTYALVNDNEYCAKSVDGKYCFQVFGDPEIAIQQTVNAIVESEEKLARDAQQQSHLMFEKVNKLEQEVEELKLKMGENKTVQQEVPVQQDVTINVQPVPISDSHASVERVVTQSEVTQPAVVQADVAQRNVTKSNVAQPDVVQEDVGQSGVAQPTISRTDVVKPDVAEEGAAQSDVAQPKIPEPIVVQSDVAQPAVAQSNVDQRAKVVRMEIELLDVLTSEMSNNTTVKNGAAPSQENIATIVELDALCPSAERDNTAEVVHMEIEIDDLLTTECKVNSKRGSQPNATKNSSHKQKAIAQKSHTKQQKVASTYTGNANTIHAQKGNVLVSPDSFSVSAKQNTSAMKTREEIAAEKKAKQEAEKRLAQQRKAEKERQAKLLKEKKKSEEEKRRLEKEAENEKRKAEKAAKLAEERAQREKEAQEYKEKAKQMEKEMAEEKERKRQQRIEAKELKNARKAAQKAKEEEETKAWMEASKTFNDKYIPPLPKPRKEEEVPLMFKKKVEKEAEKKRKEMEMANQAPSTSESRTEHRRGDSFYKPSLPVSSSCGRVDMNGSKNEPVPEDPKNAKKEKNVVEEEVVVDLPDFPEESE